MTIEQEANHEWLSVTNLILIFILFCAMIISVI